MRSKKRDEQKRLVSENGLIIVLIAILVLLVVLVFILYIIYPSPTGNTVFENLFDVKGIKTSSNLDDSVTFESNYFMINLSTVELKLNSLSFRNQTTDQWTKYYISVRGEFANASGIYSTTNLIPQIYNFTIGNHTIVKYSAFEGTVFWTFWFDLNNDSRQLQAQRFIYVPFGSSTVNKTMNGVSLVFNASNKYFPSENFNYTYFGVGGNYTGGYFDYNYSGNGMRIYFRNILNSTYSNNSNELYYIFHNSSYDWNKQIDYRSFTFVPYISGDNLDNYNNYMQVYELSHNLTNVELVGSLLTRSRNYSGGVRDWFNEGNAPTWFRHGAWNPNSGGFFIDDWSTGTAIGAVLRTYYVTQDPFYLERAIDLIDYQVNYSSNIFKQRFTPNTTNSINYPFGRIWHSFDIGNITGINYYNSLALNSSNWFISVETWNSSGCHIYTNIAETIYISTGLMKAYQYTGNTIFFNISQKWASCAASEEIDPSTGLLMQGGSKYYWSRAQGWWMEAYPIWDSLYDIADGNKTVFASYFSNMTYALINRQAGVWYRNVTDPNTGLEASGGTEIAAGMAEGYTLNKINASALQSSINALCFVTNNYLMSDGTIINTYYNSRQQNDPLPYTQEGYVWAAQALGIKDIVNPSNRDQLYTSFNEGVLICNGGQITDNRGSSIYLSNSTIIKYFIDNNLLKNITIWGLNDNLNLVLSGMNNSTQYNITNIDLMTGHQTSQLINSDSSGKVNFNITLNGKSQIIAETVSSATSQYHPADISNNSKIDSTELMRYNYCKMNGTFDLRCKPFYGDWIDPTYIPNAASIWASTADGRYYYNSSAPGCPSCWVSG